MVLMMSKKPALDGGELGILGDMVCLGDDQRFDGGALGEGDQEVVDVFVVRGLGHVIAEGHVNLEAAHVWRVGVEHLCHDHQVDQPFDVGLQCGLGCDEVIQEVKRMERVGGRVEACGPEDLADLERDACARGLLVRVEVDVGAEGDVDVDLSVPCESNEGSVQREVVQGEAGLEEVDEVAAGEDLVLCGA